ncbi:hypothetical protein HPP92_001255 [Vanilla planifolia]|uniref:Vacuolar protein sorting-associated protein 13 VPS13 adaptor binding domain-containing protein n=1 Tax=Vanilla planifolia TaxID=51239 RepID=A0A835SCB6_VANPL|nr:hypothetical protein HPP92_001255 [Vanilla planifolia]
MSRLQPSINNNSRRLVISVFILLAQITCGVKLSHCQTSFYMKIGQGSYDHFDPFRCCISVEDHSLSSFGAARKCPSLIHNVTENKNSLPISLALVVESCGFSHSIVIAKGNSASCFAVDSTHDLEVTYRIEGYKPVVSKFPRTETFSEIAKFSGSKYFLHERIYFYSCASSGLLCVNLEKVLHQSCSAREIILYTSYLLYNCTGLSLAIVDRNHEHKGIAHIILPSYQILEQEQVEDGKQGLASLTSQFKSFQGFVSMEEKVKQSSYLFLNSSMNGDRDKYPEYPSGKAGNSVESTVHSLSEEAMPYMYDPVDHIPAANFCGSTNVTIPKSNATGAFLISATLITAMGELSGRTKAIAFQPRYIICNACNKDLCFKQKGTNIFNYLPVGKHCHLHLSDFSRELLVSLRFNDRGWQWSGCFLPDCLGDVQLKMRNYISGELIMIRVEVQNADLALRDEKLIPRSDGSYSTQLILLSEDKTGFMPYRIDNFSMERLRIYQHRCESMETIVHPYTSSKYAWDEPYYAHRIIVEVPGEQILGTYNLDNIQEDAPIHLPSTSEKPERKLFISVHADGAMKVLSIIDSSYHIVRDTIGSNFAGLKDKRKSEPEVNFSEVVKFHFPFVGISLMSSNPKELIFICVRGATTVFMQSSEKQKFISQISSLQIDNQQSDTPYPVVVSFDNENKGRSMDSSKYKDNFLQNQHDDMGSSIIGVPVFYLSASKWRRSDVLLISFEYITLRLAPLCLELDEQFILCLLEFSRNVYSRLQRTSVKSFHQGLVYCNEGSYNLTWYKKFFISYT